MSLKPGTRLGPYEIVSPLGAGGMGEVYRARDTRLHRDVAIKVLPPEMAADEAALARFEREALAVAALNHPNILALHDVGADHGISYAVTELLEGETLRQRLAQEGPPAPRRVIDVAAQIAHGLAAAHAGGIVHRDLKPENVFLTRDGRVKILDFGIATQEAADPDATTAETMARTEAGLVMGTLGYMAPEQIRGAPATPRSDLFSFGLVVFELFSGANPFSRETPPETMTATLREPAPPLIAAPPAVARLVERCLEKAPEDRPESTRDLALFLDTLLLGHVPVALDPERAAAQAGMLHRLRLRILGVAAGLVLALTGLAWIYISTMAERVADAAVASGLDRAQTLVASAQDGRLADLQRTATLVASFPELKALFETDAATIRDFLLTYQQRNPNTPLLAALAPGGLAIARTDSSRLLDPASGTRWLDRLSGGDQVPAGVISIDDRLYHAAVAPAEAGGTIFGFVVAAAPIDEDFAGVLRDVTHAEAIIVDPESVLGSTIRDGLVPWTSLTAWHDSGGSDQRVQPVTIGTQRFAAREAPLTTDPDVAVIVLTSRDEAVAPYRQIQSGLLLIGLLAVLVAIAGSAWLARSLTRSLAPPPAGD